MEEIVKYLFNIKELEVIEEGNFSDVEKYFETDYDRANPLMQEIASQHFY